MTRINVLDPCELVDEFLAAERYEMLRVFTYAAKYRTRLLHELERGKLPPTYRLGVGHVRFFASRTGYLRRRYEALSEECVERGYTLTNTVPPDPIPGLDADWEPTPEARLINLARLREKLLAPGKRFRYAGEWVPPDFYGSM